MMAGSGDGLPDLSRSRALVIGNSAYRDSKISDLPAARASAEAMAELLTSSLCAWPPDRVTVLVDVATPSDLARYVGEAVREAEDVLLIYYAGYGIRTPKGELALALAETDWRPEIMPHTAMRYEHLAGLLRESLARTRLVFLDCAFAGLANDDNVHFVDDADSGSSVQDRLSPSDGSYTVDGFYFLGASSRYEKARTSLNGQLASFTAALIRVVREGIPGRSEVLRLDDIYREISRRLVGEGDPRPVRSTTGSLGTYPFARNVAPTELASAGAQGAEAYRRARAVQESVRLWESKLLVVGEATVGKTSLFKRLTGGQYDPAEGQTHGVHVDELQLDHPREPATWMRLHVWDFGGQLEYRATQRFYLTDRSLFLLVWNSRARWQDGKVIAWLDVIAARAPKSPVLVVATHGDEPSAATLPSDLQSRYPQVKGIFTIDSASGSGIDALRHAVRQQAAGLPMMGTEWPRAWADASDAVRAMPGYAATTRQVLQRMADAGVRDPVDQEVIARWLHDLGDVVFFADDLELSQRIILHPTWLDAKITAVLDSSDVAARRGTLCRAERDRLWDDLDDPDLSDRLIQMMERFDLAYRVGDAGTSSEVALVVERLDEARPAGADQAWEQASDVPATEEIGIAYRLKSRQAGIPTWFIAREHRYTTGLHWSRGVLLNDRDPQYPSWALLADDGRDQPTVELRVRGRFPVRFLSVLAEAFEQILGQRYPGLLEQRLVPCLCTERSDPPCGHLFPLEDLILEATDQEPGADRKVRCPRSKRKLHAHTMLDGLRGSSLETAISDLADGADALREAIAEQSSALAEIDQRQLATLNGIRALLENRCAAGVHCPSLFEVTDVGRTGFPPQKTFQLRMWCEWPYGSDGPHPLPDDHGVYRVRRMPPWLRAYLPYLSALATALGLITPFAAPTLTLAGAHLSGRTLAGFETVAKLAEDLKGENKDTDGTDLLVRAVGGGPLPRAEVGADFRVLRAALIELDPRQEWGGLSPVERPEDQRIVYLCREHVRALDYPYRATGGARQVCR